MNQPDRYARFVLPEGVSQVEYHQDTKIKHAGQYTIRLEDHTLGNLVRQQLHLNPEVVFAGYRIPHPLDPLMVVRIQTTEQSTPTAAMLQAVKELQGEVDELKQQLQMCAPRAQEPHEQHHQQQQPPYMGGYQGHADGYGGYGGGAGGYGGYQVPPGGGYGAY